MEGSKRKRQASNMDVQEEENDSSLSPKAKKSPSLQLLEGTEDSVVILDAGAQYGKVCDVAAVIIFVPEATIFCQNLIYTAQLVCVLLTNDSNRSCFAPY